MRHDGGARRASSPQDRRPAGSRTIQKGGHDAEPRPHPGRLLVRRPAALLALVPRPVVIFVAGALAGSLGKVIIAPLDRVKILLQVKGGLQSGAVGAAAKRGGILRSMRAIVQEEGVLSLWKGCLPQVLRVVPYSATQLASYEALKHLVRNEDGDLTVTSRLLAGAGAGIIATLVTYPLDTLRLRLAVDPNARTLTGATAALVREGGVVALYRGLAPSLIGIAPYMALELASFDLLPQQMGTFTCGVVAALIATTFCYPLDTVRRQMQLQRHQYRSILGTARRVVGKDGAGGLYRGFTANAVKNLPNKGVKLSTFAAVKSLRTHSEVAYAEEVELEKARARDFEFKGRPLGPIEAWASVSGDKRGAS